jgi:hypothetical protein
LCELKDSKLIKNAGFFLYENVIMCGEVIGANRFFLIASLNSVTISSDDASAYLPYIYVSKEYS